MNPFKDSVDVPHKLQYASSLPAEKTNEGARRTAENSFQKLANWYGQLRRLPLIPELFCPVDS